MKKVVKAKNVKAAKVVAPKAAPKKVASPPAKKAGIPPRAIYRTVKGTMPATKTRAMARAKAHETIATEGVADDEVDDIDETEKYPFG